jgi:hypothetical protein
LGSSWGTTAKGQWVSEPPQAWTASTICVAGMLVHKMGNHVNPMLQRREELAKYSLNIKSYKN